MADESLITVTVKMMSGAISFGPEALPKELTVRELKTLFNMGAPKEILFGSRLMQDDETLEELPLKIDLTVALVSLGSLRAQDAVAALSSVDIDGLIDSRPPFAVPAYIGCLLALEAVHGRDPNKWYKLEFGGVPLLPRGCKTGQIRQFQAMYWPNGRMFPIEPLLDSLRAIDHVALELAVNNDGELRNELQTLFAAFSENFAKGAWSVVFQWLEVSIRPLLVD